MSGKISLLIIIGWIFLFLSGCTSGNKDSVLPERELTRDFREYWFAGEAEITSFNLEQSRYGEPRPGTAVLIFVTEDFLPGKQVKADAPNKKNIPVLKLNSTKNFTTGIYPYSIMQSIFYPLEGNSHAVKVAASIQEWCGQVYMQLNNRNSFKITSHSYFEGEADEELILPKTHLENEVWTQLRIDPDLLPAGEIKMIPSLEFIRLAHIDMAAYNATAEFYQDSGAAVYQISYPELGRSLQIRYQNFFPYKILGWEETWRIDNEEFTTKATKMEEIKTDYWNKNSNKHLPLRDKLNLN